MTMPDTSASGMKEAMELLSARTFNMNEMLSTDEYCSAVKRVIIESDDQVVTLSAMTTLAAAVLKVAAKRCDMTDQELLSTIALTL